MQGPADIRIACREATMQRWENLIATSDRKQGVGFRFHWVNHSELPDWETGPTTHEMCRRWGLEGWELVAVPVYQTEASGIGNWGASAFFFYIFSFVFKRPL
jgi:hypothetical protein